MKEEKNSPVNPLQIVIICVAALAVIGSIGFLSFGSGPRQPELPTVADVTKQATELAMKYKGDPSKLTPHEREIVNAASMNMADRFMKTAYEFKSKQAAGQAPASVN